MFNIIQNKNLFFAFFFSFVISTAVFLITSSFIEQKEVLKTMKVDIHQGFDNLKTSQISDRDDLKKQLALLREELIRFKSQEEQSQVLGLTKTSLDNDLPIPTIHAQVDIKGIIKLKNNWPKAEVYQDMKASSKIIGQLVKDKLYFVYGEDPNWYKIEYDLGQYGWIQKSLVDEL